MKIHKFVQRFPLNAGMEKYSRHKVEKKKYKQYRSPPPTPQKNQQTHTKQPKIQFLSLTKTNISQTP